MRRSDFIVLPILSYLCVNECYMVSRCSRSACVVCAGRRGPVRRAGVPRRRSPALGLPDDVVVTRSTSVVATGGGPGQRVLAVTRARSNHCEDPAAFRALRSVGGAGARVLAPLRGVGAPSRAQKRNLFALPATRSVRLVARFSRCFRTLAAPSWPAGSLGGWQDFPQWVSWLIRAPLRLSPLARLQFPMHTFDFPGGHIKKVPLT